LPPGLADDDLKIQLLMFAILPMCASMQNRLTHLPLVISGSQAAMGVPNKSKN
jgi:hypothetical protein